MSQSALLVIDAQESFRHRPYWSEVDYPAYVREQQRLIDGCVARGIPVVSVFHVEGTGDFSHASGHVKTLRELSVKADLTVEKHVHSALASSELDNWLTAHGISRLIISGIRSEQCCETTARAGFDRGFRVDYVVDATLTFAMKHPLTGTMFSAAEIKERCALVLHDRFARVCNVDTALTDATSKPDGAAKAA